ncbi:class I SAM-dependent methyltransferase [Luteimonas marina]|uniref:Class I SAM-dependent methyltransferase n=1 Tax=Luteimonas marina TaxID=488485 RepID=A0A5C5U9R4_9GAMM|nr:class I SAM-dependent methyltransferase [Luteimonas marina]TWT22290.1 class I SAM-dependent methyltransferase [Luteimonas marina]
MVRNPTLRAGLLALALATALPAALAAESAVEEARPAPDAALQAAIAGDWRSEANRARDPYRHPAQTLAFFGLQPGQTVVEITPGGGWYAEILAPYLRGNGSYVAAIVDPAAVAEGRGRDYQQRSKDNLEKRFADAPAQFDAATVVGYDPAAPKFGDAGSADLVLTFRNVHNWRGSGQAEGMFKGFFDVLRPGGVLGVVEHRAATDVPADDKSGYVGQAQVIALAEAAGFRLDAKSEVNANPKDGKDHPNGVWTLPPGNNHDAEDAEKYRAIGESDRMTLRFVKPRSE